MWHDMKTDLGLVPVPIKYSPSDDRDSGWMTSRHNQFSVDVLKKGFAVAVHSAGEAYDTLTWDPDHLYEPDVRIGKGWNYKNGRPISTFADRLDHREHLDHCRIYNHKVIGLTDQESILHNADPLGYEAKYDSRNQQFFKAHAADLGNTIPSSTIANRVALIDAARLNGRKMAKDLNDSFAQAAAISLTETFAATEIAHLANTGGGLFNVVTAGTSAAAAKATLATAGVAAPLHVVGTVIGRALRVHRMKPNEKSSTNLKNNSESILSEARQERDVCLEKIDELVRKYVSTRAKSKGI